MIKAFKIKGNKPKPVKWFSVDEYCTKQNKQSNITYPALEMSILVRADFVHEQRRHRQSSNPFSKLTIADRDMIAGDESAKFVVSNKNLTESVKESKNI